MRAAIVILFVACAGAADLPLGIVEKVEQDAVTLRFDAAVRLAAGQMVALYGPGTVVKHPLTRKVVTENRRMLAKVQVLGPESDGLRGRILWREGQSAPEVGWDAIPLPGEAAPNAPPVKTVATLPAVTAAAGGTVTIKAPISDPDGDALVFTWELIGSTGRCGRVEARTTTIAEAIWTAPGVAPEGGIALSVTAHDQLGQSVTLNIPLELKGIEDVRRQRKVYAGFGAEQEPVWKYIQGCEDGGWVGLDDGGRILRVSSGWQQAKPVTLAEGSVRRPVAAVTHARELYVLDEGKVQVFSEAGQPRRSCTGFGSPKDLAVGADGSVYVADSEAGGVMVFELSGKFRARIGRASPEDGFTDLQRICLDGEGVLICLDAKSRRLLRFSHDLRRLDTWTIVGDAKLMPVDLTWHPRGLMVLLADGSIQIYNAKGVVSETWKSASNSGLVDDLELAQSLSRDIAGDVVVLYARGILVRHAPGGQVTGVRGSQLRSGLPIWSADATGRTFGLNGDYGLIHVHDAEGWRTARVGGQARKGGPFGEAAAMAVKPDGSVLAVLDVDKKTVNSFDGRDWRKPPLVFGGAGKNNGQFQGPLSLALDEAGRCYVVDGDAYKVSVFDAQGVFLFAFGERGSAAHQLDTPTLIAVAPAGDAAFVFDADTYEVKKFAVDQAAKSARHVGNGGGKGYELGQLRTPVVMGVDRIGILHIFDSKREDVQAIDFRGNSALPLTARKTEEVLRSAITMALSPDGQMLLISDGEQVGLR